jgi:uncharacterized protein YggE
VIGIAAFCVWRTTQDERYEPERIISVTGRATMTEYADQATIRLGVQIDSVPTSQEAVNELNTQVERVMAAIRDSGIEANNISTQQYSTQPNYTYPNGVQELTGYTASQTVVITVRNEDSEQLENQVELAVQAATQAGANTVQNISYGTDSDGAAFDAAVQDAIRNAREKAPEYADAAGVELDGIVGWYVRQDYPMPYERGMAYAEGMGGAPDVARPSLPAGEEQTEVVVEVNFEIKE